MTFTNAVQLGDGDINTTRDALASAIGEAATLEAAATIAIFNGLVRVADGTGIQLDAGVFAASADFRGSLGLGQFAGAANSADITGAETKPERVSELFG